jgi:hypothetical protein
MFQYSNAISAAVRCAFLMSALAASSAGLFFPTRAQTHWVVTVDVSNGASKPRYSVNPPADHCTCLEANPSPPPSAENLYVCPQDTVMWTAITSPGDQPNKWRSKLVVFHEDRIFLKGGVKKQVFYAIQNQSDGGDIDKNAPKGTQHEYHVAVFDKNVPELYTDDPKIIIGGGRDIETIRKRADAIQQQADEIGKLAEQVAREAKELKKESDKP